VDEFLERSAAAYDEIVVGDPWDRATDVGPLIRPEHRASVEYFVEEAVEQGGRIAAGGGRPPMERGWYTNPTLVVNVDNSSRIAREEIFGPVAVALPYGDVDEAVRIANDSPTVLPPTSTGPHRRRFGRRIAPAGRDGLGERRWGAAARRHDRRLQAERDRREQGRWGIEEFLEPQHIQWALP